MRTAYKFLAPGGVSPFIRFRWPRAGTWVTAPDEQEESWIFACRDRDLPYWLERELWVIELDEPVRELRFQLAASRARLLRRVSRWDEDLRREYARACALRARDLVLPAAPPELRGGLERARGPEEVAAVVGKASVTSIITSYLGDAARIGARGDGATASYVTCVLAATLKGDAAGFEAERAWQAGWLGERVGPEAG